MDRVLVNCFNPRSLNNLHKGFLANGCNVETLFFDPELDEKTELLIKRLDKAVNSFKPDFIYTYGWWKIGIDLDAYLGYIKKKGFYHVYWAYDDPVCFSEISLPMAKGADLVFTTAGECIPRYGEHGIKAYLQLHACCREEHFKVLKSPLYCNDILLMANNYGTLEKTDRAYCRIDGINNVLKPLIDNKYDMMVWGLWWTDWNKGYVLPSDYYGGVIEKGKEAYAYSSCKISLGLQTVAGSVTHFSVRTVEAMACGAFHLSQYSPALETYFKKGIHMEWSKTPDETLELVNFYLSRNSAREKVALKGQEEVYKKHSLKYRIHCVLDRIHSTRY